jgi:hypothetical protein
MLAALLAAVGTDAQAPPKNTPPPQAPGFHLEGQPQLEIPFGDADAYRRTVDKFLALHDRMQELRDDFSRAAQEVLTRASTLEAQKKVKSCPEGEVAAPYARAFALGQQYLRSGRELERSFSQVRDLDQLGETAALTPDYRFKVRRVLELYKQLVADYREMKVSFHDQLAQEVRFLGCDPDRLVARAEQAGMQTAAADGATMAGADPAREPTAGKAAKPLDEPRVAQSVTFFVDNLRCREGARVYLDQVPLGEVSSASRAGFRGKAGPHDLCVLAASDKRACGAAGTVRRAYLHEGFTLALRCGSR